VKDDSDRLTVGGIFFFFFCSEKRERKRIGHDYYTSNFFEKLEEKFQFLCCEDEFSAEVVVQAEGMKNSLDIHTMCSNYNLNSQKHDNSLLAQFYFGEFTVFNQFEMNFNEFSVAADEELNAVATELDSFDGRKDPERCATLVYQLRQCQDKV